VDHTVKRRLPGLVRVAVQHRRPAGHGNRRGNCSGAPAVKASGGFVLRVGVVDGNNGPLGGVIRAELGAARAAIPRQQTQQTRQRCNGGLARPRASWTEGGGQRAGSGFVL
jgi:hypothetical protein